jgi:N-acetylneuraminic acid mutarotase
LARAGRPTAVWTGTRMIVWGGSIYDMYAGSYTETNTGRIYDPATDSWKATSTTGAPPAASGHTAVWTGSRMIVWGGYSREGWRSTGGVYDPATDTWTLTSLSGAPSGRGYHTAVWTGSRMIVWGGWDGSRTSAMVRPTIPSLIRGRRWLAPLFAAHTRRCGRAPG